MPDHKKTDTDSEQISDAAVSIDSCISGLQSICKTADNSVMPKLIPCWQGQAKDSFEEKFILFILELTNLTAGYDELNEQLKKAAAAYAKADESVLQITAGLPK